MGKLATLLFFQLSNYTSISHFSFFFLIYHTNILNIACFFFCYNSAIVPVVAPASAKRTWFLNQVVDMLESINRNKILRFIGKLDVFDTILQLAITIFPIFQTLETGLTRYLKNLFVLRTINNLIPVIKSGNAEDALDTVLRLYETLEENHIDRFRVSLMCIRFFTAHFDLP